MGLLVEGEAKAYPVDACPKKPFPDEVGGKKVTIHCDAKARTAHAVDAAGKELPTTMAYWFAWAAFHPKTNIHTFSKKSKRK